MALERLERIGPSIGSGFGSGAATNLLRRSTEVVSREVGGETVVVPVCRGVGDLDSIYTFNALGTRLWTLLAENRTEEELAAFVAQHFAVSEETAQRDVQLFLRELQEAGLLHVA
jgi:coenzyme PQQ synthesis protein D (PqqD)